MAVFNSLLFGGQVVIVTGAGHGIGHVIAKQFRHLGTTAVVLDRPQLIESPEFKHQGIGLDLADRNAVEKVMDQVVNDYSRCDILVNNARGGYRTAPLMEDADNFEATMSVGVRAPMIMSQQFMRYAQANPGTARAIVNISSTAASTVSGESCSYHLAKASLEALTRYFAVEGGKHQLRVNAVAPGFIVQDEHQQRFHSEENESYRSLAHNVHPGQAVGSAADVANTVMFLASTASRFITGEILTVSGGLNLQDNWAAALALSGDQG